jgi:hypothetical protein
MKAIEWVEAGRRTKRLLLLSSYQIGGVVCAMEMCEFVETKFVNEALDCTLFLGLAI